jgi:fructokinase
MDISCVQLDSQHATGTVEVSLEQGQPSFVFTEDVAWDYFEWTPEWESLAAQADAVCFGSLAQRSSLAQATIRSFVQATRPETLRLLDVNLRPPFYSAQLLHESLQLANAVKLNDAELTLLGQLLGFTRASDEANARYLMETYNLQLLCLTRGARGSLLFSPTETVAHEVLPITVADTIGAGDAFTAALVHHYLRHTPLQELGLAANRLGAWVASQVGAMPNIDQAILAQLR